MLRLRRLICALFPPRRPAQRRFATTATLEVLEARILPAVFSVSVSSDAEAGQPGYDNTLRWAVDQANAHPGADEVHVLVDTELTSAVQIIDDVVVRGRIHPSSGTPVVVNGGGRAHRLFVIDDADDDRLDVIFETLTIRNAGDGITPIAGAGIHNSENLRLDTVYLRDNAAGAANGGGLFHQLGDLRIINSTLSHNSAANGGGIYIADTSASAQLINTTLSLNTVTSDGGGLYANSSTVLRSTTIVSNQADSDGEGMGEGGGIRSAGHVLAHNSIIAENFLQELHLRDEISGLLVGGSSFNVLSGGGTGGLTHDPRNGTGDGLGNHLGAHSIFEHQLRRDSGPIPVHRPYIGAIDRGNAAEAVSFDGTPLQKDQLGQPRIRNGNLDNEATLDVGAVELPVTNVIPSFGIHTTKDGIDGDYSEFELTLRELVEIANNSTRTVSAGIRSLPITLTDGPLYLTGSLRLRGGTISGNNVSRLFHIDGGELTLEGTILQDGYAGDDDVAAGLGGAILNDGGRLWLEDAHIHSSTAVDGAAVYNRQGEAIIHRSTLEGNTATEGATFTNDAGNNDADAWLYNITVSGNNGHGLANTRGDAELVVHHATIVKNSGDGINNGGQLLVTNSLVVGNEGDNLTGDGTLSDSAGNITEGELEQLIDPQLTTGLDFRPYHRLLSGSPAVDAAAPVSVPVPYVRGTGLSRDGQPLPPGQWDANYTANAVTHLPAAGWTPNQPDGQWITRSIDVSPQPGTLTFSMGAATSLFNSESIRFTADVATNTEFLSTSVGTEQTNIRSTVAETSKLETAGVPRFVLYDFYVPENTRLALLVANASATGQLATDQLGVARGQSGRIGSQPRADIGAVEAAATGPLIVDQLSDVSDGDFSTGQLSLREAMEIANQRPGSDHILFAETAHGTILLEDDLPVITESLQISGLGASATVIDGQNDHRLMVIQNVTADVSLSGMTLTGGNGSAIRSRAGHLQVDASELTGNKTQGHGGAVFITSGTFEIRDTAITNNEARFDGGGIYVQTDAQEISRIVNSTISGNLAGRTGGGIHAWTDFLGRLIINHSTITDNRADVDQAGGLAVIRAQVEVQSSIIAGNGSFDVMQPFPSQTNRIHSAGYNLIGTGNVSEFDHQTDQIEVTEPGLLPLRDYGGPTRTHALKADSPAIDSGAPSEENTQGLTFDQRLSFARRVDGDGENGARADIGAFERDLTRIPVITGPSGVFRESPVALTWQGQGAAESFDIYLELLQSGTNEQIVRETVTGTRWNLTESLGIGRYRFWMRASFGPDDHSVWVSRDFQVNQRVELTPVDFHLQTAPTLEWSSVAGASGYRVYLYNTTTRTVVTDEVVADTSYIPPNSEFGRYRIWVQAIGAQNFAATWSSPEEYYLGPAPTSPASPTYFNPVAFFWSRREDVSSLRLYVQQGREVIIDQEVPGTAPFIFDQLLPAGDYRWWLQTTDSVGQPVAWSQPATFTIGGRTDITMVYGEEGASSVHWTKVENARDYQVFVYNDDRKTVVENLQGIAGTTLQLALNEGNYRIWVRPFEYNGTPGAWSRPFAHRVIRTPGPSMGNIAATAPGLGHVVTLSWDSIENVSYEVSMRAGSLAASERTAQSSVTTTVTPGHVWTWWVRTVQPGRLYGPWSAPQTLDLTGRAVITGPDSPAGNRPTITWGAVTDAVSYTLQLDDLTGGENNILRVEGITAAEFTVESQLPAGTYRVWILALGEDDRRAPWSLAHTFLII